MHADNGLIKSMIAKAKAAIADVTATADQDARTTAFARLPRQSAS